MASFAGRKTAVYAEKAEREKKALHVGGIVGGTAWFGTFRYDARSLVRDAGMALAAAAWLRRKLRRRRH